MEILDTKPEDLAHLWRVTGHDPIRHVYELEAVLPQNRQEPICVELSGLVTGLSFAANNQLVFLLQGRIFRAVKDETGALKIATTFRAAIHSVHPAIRLPGTVAICPFVEIPRNAS